MSQPAAPRPHLLAGFLAAFLLTLAAPRGASAQEIGVLVSPGPLSRAHAKLEGLANCQKCHEPGKKVTAERCLACHKPVAERIAARKGVHRDVANDCVSCHVEHAGPNAELRPLDPKVFNHVEETGFALEGKHAAIATNCEKCHKTRSFLGLRPDCASCHQDPHRGALGSACASCHPTAVAFRETASSFDHTKTAFPLSEAHRAVACAKCHVNKVYRGVKFAACTDCHTDPHGQQFALACANCHSGPTWKTEKVEHARTGFPLVGKHAGVQCASCHKQPPMRAKLEFARCAVCHGDPHRGEFKQDCAACHTPAGFRGASFDHQAKTKFALAGRHAEVPCASCHKAASTASARGGTLNADFRGLNTACVSCHTDVHSGKLGTACANCHDTRTFRVTAFKHPGPEAFYAGQHAGLACAKCHGGEGVTKTDTNGKPVTSRTYRGLGTACATCHRDVHLGQLGPNCASCHTVDAPKFAAVGFSHATTTFALAGKHTTVECSKCHRSESGAFPAATGTAVRFKGVSAECRACHKDVHLGQLGPRCETCHTPTSFKLATYTHRENPEFHSAKHATLECKSCHKPEDGRYPAGNGVAVRFAGLSSACATCHEDVHRGTLGARCESCHTTKQWPGASRAFHKSTTFPLEDRHIVVPCASCHINGQLKGTPNRCYDCHWIRRQDDRFRTRLGNACETCHRQTSWRAVSWDHGTATGFPLNAAHRGLACESCHLDQVFKGGIPTGCYGCHRRDYDATRQPAHAAAGFPTTCDTCHKASDTSWTQAGFAHTAFPLLGVHATQTCQRCHGDGVYNGKSTACVSCHQTDYTNSRNPNHAASGFPTACESCHKASDTSWTQGVFNHSTTAFPLLGVHATQTCQTCHKNGVYKGTSSACVSCHQTDYTNSRNPNHAASGFPTACESCHKASDTSWTQGVFNHSTTAFPLLGVHATQTCQTCHKNGVYKGTSSACVSCHQTDYTNSRNPNHAASGFPTACESCHKASDTNWTQATFNHATTAFPLLGVHATQTCQRCHGDGVYNGKSTACVSCHQTDYTNSRNPNHAASGFPTACESCHKASDTNWTQATFNHATTAFPLLGVHATQTCQTCHKNGVYKGTSSACVSCHQTDYTNSRNPNHTASGFPTACESCHKASDTNWTQATFNHATTAFPLLGVHATQTCQRCHGDGVYNGKSTACVSCHQTDYTNSRNPNHTASGFPTACESCHKASDTNWTQATFNHATTAFPLLGVHATQTCQTCHKNGVYKGTSSACVSCHQTDYTNSRNPNHTASGFPTACESCHKASDTGWTQGVFNHSTTAFPLVGVHATQTCQRCHGDGVYNGKSTACVSCHQTDYTNTRNPNHTASGFPTACESCHKASDTSWTQGVFNHSTTAFPLVGVHATQTCQRCHGDGVYNGKSTACVSCHQTDYTNTRNPNHIAAGFPTACETCHRASDTSWSQGTFNHTRFPIASGRHSGNPCLACHPNPSSYAVFSCTTACHPRSETDSHHRGRQGYVYDSQACYSCHPTGRGD